MILADTGIWIEFLRGRSPYPDIMGELLENRNILTHEIVFGELLQGARNRREVAELRAYWTNTPQISPPNLILRAGEFSASHGLIGKGIGILDAALVLAARENGARFWSLDKKLKAILRPGEMFQL